MEEFQYRPADVFLTRGTSLLSRLIRFFTRSLGESRTKVNHVGIVVSRGPIGEVYVVEALSEVKRHRLVEGYGDGLDEVAVYRPLNTSGKERETIVRKAESYVGRRYGISKIVCHLLDWLLLGAYLFRRLASDKYPICSWVVAHAFSAVGKNFGQPPGAAAPDDIWDFVTSNPDKYQLVRELSPIRDDREGAGRIQNRS